jgi:predicted metal-dependent enzyme (double-stranded beta helix superfamily)
MHGTTSNRGVERRETNQEEPMATHAVHPSIARFIDDVKQILAQHGDGEYGVERVAERMRELLDDPDLTQDDGEPIGNVHHGWQAPPLYVDESGLTLVRARFGPEHNTPIHNHFTWGIVGVYRGKDTYQIWRRLDDGDGAGYAEVELVEEKVLGPGDIEIIPHPPQDIHAQQGAGEDTYEFVLFGKNAMQGPRLYFDPEAKTATLVEPKRN